jgi:hypothetical protein
VVIRRNNLKLVEHGSSGGSSANSGGSSDFSGSAGTKPNSSTKLGTGIFVNEIASIKSKQFEDVEDAIDSLVGVVCKKLKIDSPIVKQALGECISDDPQLVEVVKTELKIR